ncbi:MAG: YXWGXW repeat-containing protein [Gemmataceae bacterium]|nr:YXWGXW repeat-containing protein [Gemmataceae bacterium]
MTTRFPLVGAAFIFATFLTAQEPATQEPEVLTRGQIHEAYAAAVNQEPKAGTPVPKAPPAAIEELPPDQKPEGEDVQWIPGYWAWDEDRNDYIWISGFWRQPPPGRQWVPGNWRQVGDSWQWTSGFWAGAGQNQIDYVPQPPPPPDTGPAIPAPGENYTYVPGTWVYRETRYAWRPGFWCAYRPDWVYIPAHYVWTPCGYVFVDGYWDFPLRRRGVLFAPVYFGVGYRPALVYRPRFVVYDDALYGALFIRRGCSAYYFGDYFEARYRTAGFNSWIDVRIGVGGYDPLWGYYRHHYAATPGWTVGINALYVGRYRGDIPRPPVTYVQQNTVVNNFNKTTIINNNTTVVNNVRNVTMVAPINNVDTNTVKLRPVTKVEQAAAVQSAKDVQQASIQRVKLEQQALAAATPAGSKSGQPAAITRPIRVEVPKTNVANTKPTTPPPPAPVAPPVKPEAPKEQPKAKVDAPKATTPPPLPNKAPEQPKATKPDAPKEQPKATTPPPLPNKPAEQPKSTKPDAPKEQPKVNTPPPLPNKPDAPKEQPKATTPPPLPNKPAEQPKSPDMPKYRPQSPQPVPPIKPADPPKPPTSTPMPVQPKPPVQQPPIQQPTQRPPVQQQPPPPAQKPPQQPPPPQQKQGPPNSKQGDRPPNSKDKDRPN